MGAALWVFNVQYFIVQVVVAAAWAGNGYNWGSNTISDLSNSQCGQYGARIVCSPLHAVMSTSFIVLGITILGGAVLLQKGLVANFINLFGFGFMAFAGLGAILIGFFPENSISSLHIAGAALSFLLGNVGMLLLGSSLNPLPRELRIYTVLSGVVGLAALLLFLRHVYAGLGIGGMERIVAYPQTIWMIVFGLYLLRKRHTT